MVADSITDSELFHGSPISTDIAKKRKENWLLKLKQWKIDARCKQWRRANVGEREKIIQSWRIEGKYKITDDDDIGSSPTSVLKNKEEDCFCCSDPIKEEDEEAFDDAYENWEDFNDALNFFDSEEKVVVEAKEEKKTGKNRRKKKKAKKECCDGDEIRECPICFEEMDATDLSFFPCPCGFRLCLFCHNKISEDEGVCPQCRNKYDKKKTTSGEVSFQQRGRGRGRGTLRLSPSFQGLDRA